MVLGGLWGERVVKQFGWHWAKVTFHDYGDSVAFGVVSPVCSLAIYPIEFLVGCLGDSTVDATIALSFNMLLAGTVQKMPAKGYFNLMEGVHRIVPRD